MDHDLLSIFLTEATQHLRQMLADLDAMQRGPIPEGALARLLRGAHIIKGNCGYFELRQLAELTHALESAVVRIQQSGLTPPPRIVERLRVVVETMRQMLRDAQAGESDTGRDCGPLIRELESIPGGSGETALTEARKTELRERLGALTLRQLETGAASPELESIPARLARPLAPVIEALPALASQLSRQTGKAVRWEQTGELPDVDEPVRNALHLALTQLVRNAVDHGIESPAERARQNKPIAGTLRLDIHHQPDRLAVTLTDDGAGLDRQRILQAARERGYALTALPTLPECIHLICSPGFSTRQQADDLSGRGVGMDIALTEVRKLGGTLAIKAEAGQGVQVRLVLPRCPARLAVQRLTLAGQPLAIPQSHVQEIISLTSEDFSRLQESGTWSWQGIRVPILHLSEALGLSDPAEPRTLLIADGHHPVALLVPEVTGPETVTLIPRSSQEHRHPALLAECAGADGARCTLLKLSTLNSTPSAVVSAAGDTSPAPVAAAASPPPQPVEKQVSAPETAQPAVLPGAELPRPCVLVVEDSLFSRRLISAALELSGYQAVTAGDGEEARQRLQHGETFAAVVADIDLPGLDGLQLLRWYREQPEAAAMPWIAVSGLSPQSYAARAAAAGFDAFIPKYAGHELPDLLATLLPAPEPLIRKAA